MKVIYISGPYRDNRGARFILENIRKAEAIAIWVWQRGAVALCPHLNTRLFDGIPGCPDDLWLKGDFELVKRCDAIYMIPGWRNSSGSLQERDCALKNNVPVLYHADEVIKFIEENG